MVWSCGSRFSLASTLWGVLDHPQGVHCIHAQFHQQGQGNSCSSSVPRAWRTLTKEVFSQADEKNHSAMVICSCQKAMQHIIYYAHVMKCVIKKVSQSFMSESHRTCQSYSQWKASTKAGRVGKCLEVRGQLGEGLGKGLEQNQELHFYFIDNRKTLEKCLPHLKERERNL